MCRLGIGPPIFSRASLAQPELEIPQLIQKLGFGPTPESATIAARLSPTYPLVGNAILLWWEAACRGLASNQVKTGPTWVPATVVPEGIPGPPLRRYEPNLERALEALLHDNPAALDKGVSRPKVWLRTWSDYNPDSDALILELGGTDFRAARGVELLHTTPRYLSHFDGASDNSTLQSLCESEVLSAVDFTPGILAAAMIVRIRSRGNDWLLLAQRSRRGVAWEQNAFCTTCEEAIAPNEEDHPWATVHRCIKTCEFLPDPLSSKVTDAGRVPGKIMTDSDIQLLALCREWVRNWNTVLVLSVDLHVDPDEFMAWWQTLRAKESREFKGLVCVPLETPDDRLRILRAARSGVFQRDLFPVQKAYGKPDAVERWHSTLTTVRVLLGLRHWYPDDGEWRGHIAALAKETLTS